MDMSPKRQLQPKAAFLCWRRKASAAFSTSYRADTGVTLNDSCSTAATHCSKAKAVKSSLAETAEFSRHLTNLAQCLGASGFNVKPQKLNGRN